MRRNHNIVIEALALGALILVLLFSATSSAGARDVVRSCGDIPENSQHIRIWNVSARNLRCAPARQVVLRAFFHCAHSGCRVSGGWRCNIYVLRGSNGEDFRERCTHTHDQAVRFYSGV
jgi:hypothetical protein